VDGLLNILISIPIIWWLLIRPVSRSRGVRMADLLETPIKLYILLLFVVFMGDLAESLVLPYLLPYDGDFVHMIVDNFLFTMISAPFLWLLIMRPLQRAARSEKSRSEAIQHQVIDAVISVDEKGVIQSFNPAAETIFGYSADEAEGTA
jgi:PAS domain-containing protein